RQRATPLASTTPAPTVTLVGAGDIARCDRTDDEHTAALLDTISGTVFTIGDNVLGSSSVVPDFTNCYAPTTTWGRFKARTRPAPGHMETWSRGSATYYQYWGAAAGDSGKGYYSYDLGAWHIIVLNSGGDVSTAAGSAQEQWLKADLAASTLQCTLAIWHHPRFSSAAGGVYAGVKPFRRDPCADRADGAVHSAHAGPDLTTHPGDTLKLTTTFSDAGANDAPWSYTITWGDGSSSAGTTSSASTPITAAHVYSGLGQDSVRVAVTNSQARSGSDS